VRNDKFDLGSLVVYDQAKFQLCERTRVATRGGWCPVSLSASSRAAVVPLHMYAQVGHWDQQTNNQQQQPAASSSNNSSHSQA
jgi:hypothetical protein